MEERGGEGCSGDALCSEEPERKRGYDVKETEDAAITATTKIIIIIVIIKKNDRLLITMHVDFSEF